jgi:hypothetical protein
MEKPATNRRLTPFAKRRTPPLAVTSGTASALATRMRACAARVRRRKLFVERDRCQRAGCAGLSRLMTATAISSGSLLPIRSESRRRAASNSPKARASSAFASASTASARIGAVADRDRHLPAYSGGSSQFARLPTLSRASTARSSAARSSAWRREYRAQDRLRQPLIGQKAKSRSARRRRRARLRLPPSSIRWLSASVVSVLRNHGKASPGEILDLKPSSGLGETPACRARASAASACRLCCVT